MSVLSGLLHCHLGDTKPKSRSQDRDEAVLVAIEVQFFEDLAPQCTYAAAQIPET
jgi:hypothetical protein